MKAEITIYAENCCDSLVPNAFSPNGDGLNDQFGIVTLGHPQDFVMQVYDRWGVMVFVPYNAGDKWGGTFIWKSCSRCRGILSDHQLEIQ